MSAGRGRRDEFSFAKPIELESTVIEESSDSEEEPEPAKSFLRKISTNKEIKHSACTKEGYLLKQTSSFQRWKRRYFRLKGRTLYYTKDMKHTVFDEIDLTDVSIAEHNARTGGHCFQVITAFRCLSLCAASRRQMEDWTSALKTAGKRHFVEGMDCLHAMLSGQHNWHVVSHARPTYCNVCREALSGVTSHGLSCDVCKFKCHKRCAARDTVPCKWTSLASVGQHTIEDEDGTLHAPHQWLEGNLSVSAKCSVCEKACGSVLRLQDFRCLWCKSTVHALCRPMCPPRCSLGPCKVSVVPPTALHSIGTDDSWEAHRPVGCSPLLVFVNSKSGDHMGVKFLRRFKQLLNPAQVFDLMTSGPTLGLRLFKAFNQFRILVCGGDGSVGWVLSHIDKLDLHRQCQIGVLPLGTGNDLARVLGWGSTCDDDANLAHLLEKYECATIKMLDRWSICTLVTSVPEPPRSGSISELESSVATHLSQILHSERSDNVLRSASVLCETVRQLTTHVGSSAPNNSMLRSKCAILDDKLSLLMGSLRQEGAALDPSATDVAPPMVQSPSMTPKSSRDKVLMVRANSLKKAVRGILEHVEQALDEQNSQCMLPSPSTDRPSICLQSVAELSSDVCVSPMLSPFRMSGTATTNFPLCPWSPSADSEPPWLPSSRAASSSNVSTAAAAAGDAADKLSSLQQLQSSQTSFQVPSLEVHEPSPDDSPPGVDADSASNGAATVLSADRRPSEEISRLFSGRDESSDSGQVSLVDTNPLSISPVPIGSCLESPSAAGEMLLELPAAPSPFADSRRLSGASSCGGVTPTAAVVYGSVEQLLANLPYVDEPVDELQKEKDPAPPRRSSSWSDLKLSASAAGFGQDEPFMTETKCLTGVEDAAEDDAAFLAVGIQLDPSSVEGSASLDVENSGSDDVSAGVGSMLENVLMAHADALCAPASPLVGYPAAVCGDRSFQEKGVMNNYFGIGIDAKISLDFHNKREGQPQKCRSRTKNFMWYGVLGSKELIQKTCKNLEQRVRLECDGHVIPLPSLQGIVVLNIPSFMGGTNFWGRRREEDSFISPCFDDRILEVVAVFGTAQMAASRIINLQHHRIAQCQTVQITILGDDAVPVEVDGEAWAQAPGLIRITHKNRVQMLSRNRSLEASLRTWQEKQQRRQSGTLGSALTDDEQILLKEFLDSAVHLVRACKLMLQRYETLPGGMELQQTLSQTAAVLERQIPPTGAPSVAVLAGHRPDVSDLVTSVRSLHSQGADFMHHHQTNMNVVGALELQMSSALSQMELELRHAHIAHGVVQFSTDPEGGLEKRRLSRGVFRLRLGRRESRSTSQPAPTLGSSVGATAVAAWRTAEVTAWLESIGLHEYRNDFLRHDVRGPELLSLERRDLKELGIHKIGHIKRIQQAIRDIKSVP